MLIADFTSFPPSKFWLVACSPVKVVLNRENGEKELYNQPRKFGTKAFFLLLLFTQFDGHLIIFWNGQYVVTR